MYGWFKINKILDTIGISREASTTSVVLFVTILYSKNILPYTFFKLKCQTYHRACYTHLNQLGSLLSIELIFKMFLFTKPSITWPLSI